MTTARCAACGEIRPVSDLLRITARHEPDRPAWYCCRSTLGTGQASDPRPDCLCSAARGADVHMIALAEP